MLRHYQNFPGESEENYVTEIPSRDKKLVLTRKRTVTFSGNDITLYTIAGGNIEGAIIHCESKSRYVTPGSFANGSQHCGGMHCSYFQGAQNCVTKRQNTSFTKYVLANVLLNFILTFNQQRTNPRNTMVLCWKGSLRIHSFSSLSYDRSKASSKASSPHSAIQSFLFQMRVSSPFLKVIQ